MADICFDDLGLKFRKVKGGYEVEQDRDCGEVNVVIPSEHKGMPVVAISPWGFSERYEIVTVSVPDTVERIGANAFDGCGRLREVSGAEGVRRIGERAFERCVSLERFTVPAGCVRIDRDAFSGCCGLVEVLNLSPLDLFASDAGLEAANVCTEESGAGTFFTTDDGFSWYRYKDADGEERRILAGYEGEERNLVLPGTCDGLPYEVRGGAFIDCGVIDSVRIPSGLRRIGADAFRDHRKLRKVYADDLPSWLATEFESPEANPLFPGNGILYVGGKPVFDLDIPSGIGEIGDYAFSGGAFESVSVPEGVTRIGRKAFCGCESLISATLPRGLLSIDYGAFSHCVRLGSVTSPESLESLGAYAFYGCEGLEDFTVPAGCREIGRGALSGCNCLVETRNLSSEDMRPGEPGRPSPESLRGPNVHSGDGGAGTSFKTDDGFLWCRHKDADGGMRCLLTGYTGDEKNLVLPGACDGLPYDIDSLAFEGCENLESVEIPPCVRRIGANAFEGCDSLEKVCVGSLSDWLAIGFGSWGCNPLYCGNGVLCVGGEPVTDLVIPSGTEEIGDFAFAGGPFESVVLPEGVTRVGRGAFARCVRLRSVSLPASLLSIGGGAFSDCRGLQSVTLPGSLLSIEEDAFFSCNRLVEVVNLSGLRLIPGDGGYGGVAEHAKTVKTSADGKGTFFTDEEGYMFYDSGEGLYLYGYVGGDTDLVLPVVKGRPYEICEEAFAISDVTDVTVPSGAVSSVGGYAFSYCEDLRRVSVGDGTVRIGASAFEGCAALEEVRLGRGLLMLGARAFCWCRRLTDVSLPDGLRYIGDGAFGGCENVSCIVVPGTVEHIGRGAFRTMDAVGNLHAIDVFLFDDPDRFRPVSRTWRKIYDPDEKDAREEKDICGTVKEPMTLWLYSAEKPERKGRFWHYDDEGNPVKW